MGYSPWGCKESDMTERLNFHRWEYIKKKKMCINGLINKTILAKRLKVFTVYIFFCMLHKYIHTLQISGGIQN